MGYTLARLAEGCHHALVEDAGIPGRARICALVAEALQDPDFVAACLGDDVPERKLLFEDPQFGFCILAHAYRDARESQPHDHGPSWAIYGQGVGETIMSDFALVEPAAENRPGKVRFLRSYTLKPGMAHLYNEGDLHAPRRDGPTRLIRIEGQNLEKVRRFGYRRV